MRLRLRKSFEGKWIEHLLYMRKVLSSALAHLRGNKLHDSSWYLVSWMRHPLVAQRRAPIYRWDEYQSLAVDHEVDGYSHRVIGADDEPWLFVEGLPNSADKEDWMEASNFEVM